MSTLQTDDFDYHLPENLIAQKPSEIRGGSRMLVLHRETGKCEVRKFANIAEYLSKDDTIVFNNTKVINARMFGQKKNPDGFGAKIEILLVSQTENCATWKCFLKPGKRAKVGSQIYLLDKNNELSKDDYFTVTEHNDNGSFIIVFNDNKILEKQEVYGHIPLPPYIEREDEEFDKERYQTVYAKYFGAVAAPTAGLHFTNEILSDLKDKGVNKAEVTLHVGPGTFKPVDVKDVTDHKMHLEEYELTKETAEIINQTHNKKNRVLAIGTTSVRVLESCANSDGIITENSGETDIFIYPPYKPKAVDMLLTNFHLPKSTLMMLVSAFSSKDNILKAYELAIKENFMFYSYGDCMLII